MTEINTREIAETLMLDRVREIDTSTISEQLDDYGLSPEEEERHVEEIRELITEATVTVTFPEATST